MNDAQSNGTFRVRLGLWNRLAIVAYAVGVPIGTFSAVVDRQDSLDRTRQSIIEICDKAVERGNRPYNGFDGKTPCTEMAPSTDFHVTGETWLLYLKMHALMGLMIYGLVWLAVWVAKWVLRGRKA